VWVGLRKNCVWLSDGVTFTELCSCSAVALLLRSWNHRARAPMARLGMPTPRPVANAIMSDLLKPSSSFSSVSDAVVDAGTSPAAAVALETPKLPVAAAFGLDAAAGGVVTALVSAGLLDASTLAVAQYPPYKSSMLVTS